MNIDFDSLQLNSPFYTESHLQWRQQLRKFVEREISPHIDDWEEAGELPLELWRKAAEVGLLQLGYDESYGGVSEGIDIFHTIVSSEELARCGATGISSSLTVHGIGLPPVANYGTDAMKEEVVPQVLAGEKRISLGITEPGAGSDVANISSSARREGDYYVVNGSKTFISGGMRADWLTTAVRTGGEGIGGISLLLIPMNAGGVSRTKLDKKQGWWCSDTATIYLDNVKVPVTNLIGEENQGFLPIVHNFNHERIGIVSLSLGAAKVCMEEAAQWAVDRKTFGKPLSKHQVIRHKFAEMLKRINATQAYLDMCAWQMMQGQLQVQDIAMLKVQATETMEFCAREAMQIMGGISYMRGCKTERLYREVRVMAIGGGSEEIMRDLTARQLGL
ncbi:acyl-CoA dehydrogenase [Pseudomaricurvus alkylphenolicus]|uniref:acyl-CoA dehydrogenase family protein n=1 Tax=Pseudomaricurvus alkylphenolicus TaxID=1306991 RepID=UPI001420DF50|nr:acyl-CoA dehydrogenase family protein [Pseudomaricurvus alkylphenolicus]NIB41558.1 acyl-CoA dehydrogenase [Pseudomaricurvus alkylphenolicus]